MSGAGQVEPDAAVQPPRRVRPTPAASVVVPLQQRLDAIVALHQEATGVGLCSACLLPVPCPTVQLATGAES